MKNVDYSNMAHIAIYDTLAGVTDLLANQGEFHYCQFSGLVKGRGDKPLEDSDVLEVTYDLERGFRWAKSPPSARRVYDAIQLAARRNPRHPVKEYINSTKWDTIPRAGDLFSTYFGAADSPLRRVQSKAFLVSAVARIMTPGAKVDTMPVLISPQGWGKSTAIRILARKDRWFHDTPLDLRNKDCYEAIQGRFLVEIAEMRSILSARPETVKAFLTSSTDSYRPAYGRCNVYRPRQCVFIGTSNDLQLTDSTGNRRYWPIPLETQPNWQMIEEHRDQLWAEALVLFTASYPWWLTTQEMMEAAEEEVNYYTTVDPWILQILTFWDQGWSTSFATVGDHRREYGDSYVTPHGAELTQIMHPKRTKFEATTLLAYLGVKTDRQKKSDVMRLTRLMRGLGFTSKRERDQGIRRTYWIGPTGHTGHT